MGEYFVGIGGQKCGTTWLADYLFSHPQVWPNPIKEMHVFDALFAPGQSRPMARQRISMAVDRLEAKDPRSDGEADELSASRDLLTMYIRTPERVIKRYRRYFQRRVGPSHRAFGEITPAYATLESPAFEAIQAAFPSARFIFVMRDPVDRFWSAARKALRAAPDVDVVTHLDRLLQHDRLMARSDYQGTLGTLDANVPPERALVLFYEDLFGGTGADELRRITEFLGLDSLEGDLEITANEGIETEMPAERVEVVAHTFADTYRYVSDRFSPLPARWAEHLQLISGS